MEGSISESIGVIYKARGGSYTPASVTDVSLKGKALERDGSGERGG